MARSQTAIYLSKFPAEKNGDLTAVYRIDGGTRNEKRLVMRQLIKSIQTK